VAMRNPAQSKIPVYELYHPPDDKIRPFTVSHSEGDFIQKKIWLSPHRKNYYLLMYITRGSGRYWVDMMPYEFKAGTLFFSTPEQVHIKEDVKTSGSVICMTKDFFAMDQNADLLRLPFLQNTHFENELKLMPEDHIRLQQLLHDIEREYNQPTELQDEMLYACIRVLLLYLARLYNKQYHDTEWAHKNSIYRRFQSSIEDNYKTIRDVKSYSSLLNISASHLNALIKEKSGKTVMTHLHERLILEAKRLLYNTEMSVKEIAFELGFRDASYFVRFFKKATSATPLDYRTRIIE
jgi:AraC family transcriptional regulator, transcriptional activator of pobA